ncbi:MAG: TadE/TadG family type IV pilus assembly protein [Blastopirellula sp. JB062]
MKYEKTRRTGATMIEGAFCLVIVFFLVVGMLEFGIASLRRNLLRDGAARVARAAMLRGQNSELSEWGANHLEFNAASDDPIAEAIRPSLTTMAPEDVRIVIDWPDGDNLTEQRIHVVVQYDHQFLFGNVWLMDQLSLIAETQMRIEK